MSSHMKAVWATIGIWGAIATVILLMTLIESIALKIFLGIASIIIAALIAGAIALTYLIIRDAIDERRRK